MTTHYPNGVTRQLARHLLALAFAETPRPERPTVDKVTDFVRKRLGGDLSQSDATLVRGLAEENDIGAVSSARQLRLLTIFGLAEVERWWQRLPSNERRPEPLRPPAEVLRAAIRVATAKNVPSDEDKTTLDRWVRTKGIGIVAHMAGYVVEERGLPVPFDEKAFINAVETRLKALGGSVSEPFLAVVVGRLLLDGNTDPRRSDFGYGVKRAYDTGVEESFATPGIPNKEHYERIAEDFRTLRQGQDIRYQELAAVADHVITSAEEGWDILNRDTRRSQIEVGFIKYADGTVDTGFSSLDLPSLVSEDASNQEIEPINCQSVAMCAAAYEIEQTGAFDVVDQMVGLFMQGMIPVRDDSGGRALNRYYWGSDDRLDAANRAELFARVLGRGDIGSIGAQPNTSFEQLLMRFVAALVRYDSNLQVATVVTVDARDRVGSSEQVRKTAQDFAANASLYGWGFTVFAARKLSKQIDQVFDVLGQETLQRAYGVTGAWQLVERVSAVELGSTPAIVQHRTRAKAIKDILDALAAHASELSKSGGVQRFLPNLDDLRGTSHGLGPTVPVEEYERLVAAANNLLAVSGTTEEEITSLSAPVASPARGSIPTIGADNGGPAANIDQLRQLAQQGQFDQLQKLLGAGIGSGIGIG